MIHRACANSSKMTTENDENRRRLFDSAMQGQWDEAIRLYQQHPWLRLQKITESDDTALHIAVLDHKEWVVRKMVELVTTSKKPKESPAVLKSTNEAGDTPLHLAALKGSASMCDCLAGIGDIVSMRNTAGENPLFMAARHGSIKTFISLKRHASDLDIVRHRDGKGETVLHRAIAHGHFSKHFTPKLIEKICVRNLLSCNVLYCVGPR